MADSRSFKLVITSLVLMLTLWESTVLGRPNTKHDSSIRSNDVLSLPQNTKRSWDLTYAAEGEDEAIMPLVEEAEMDLSSEPAIEKMWLNIGKGFQETRETTRNSDIELECEAVGSPPPKVFWLKNGLPLESQITIVTADANMKNNVIFDKFGNNGMANVKSKLPIKCAQPEDEGTYTCFAINRGKQVSASTVVTVNDDDLKVPRGSCEYRLSLFSFKKSKKGSSALIVNSETFHMENMGRHISIPCKAVGKPRPQVTWFYQQGKKIISGKKFQVSSSGSLIIRTLAWDDMGVYTCVAENAFGKDTITTFVYPLAEEDESEGENEES
ncbi:Neural/ectodermal development factor IMP-L2 [Orchesella cincta]|uniref:Neural/ectodermal development factor IMP-L2 n=1 Tax=Orchesella cincta TaxID=48709 RepID=A0A1D2MS11_ORCCI|nr:Neural/ectodermal development factor IMP-L2 [Orchesella cincta]